MSYNIFYKQKKINKTEEEGIWEAPAIIEMHFNYRNVQILVWYNMKAKYIYLLITQYFVSFQFEFFSKSK